FNHPRAQRDRGSLGRLLGEINGALGQLLVTEGLFFLVDGHRASSKEMALDIIAHSLGGDDAVFRALGLWPPSRVGQAPLPGDWQPPYRHPSAATGRI